MFPKEPYRRRAIIVLDEFNIERLMDESGSAHALFDEQAYVLQFPVDSRGTTPTGLQNILDKGLDRPGTILIQSPHDPDVYEEATVAPQNFALSKFMYFSILCQQLGAKEVRVEQMRFQSRTKADSIEVEGDSARLRTAGKAGISSEELRSFSEQIKLHDSFDGGKADIPAAVELLRSRGLAADPTMDSLVEMRQSASNTLNKRSLNLNLSNEAKRNLALAGRLKVPNFVDLSIDYRRGINDQHEYGLTVSVEF